MIKSENPISEIESQLREQAEKSYGIVAVVNRYMQSIKELINIPILLECFGEVVANSNLKEVIDEIVTQTRLELNLPT